MGHLTPSEVMEFVEERLLWYGKCAEFYQELQRPYDVMYEYGKVFALEEVLEFLKGERK